MASNLNGGFRVFGHEIGDATDFVVVGVVDDRAVGGELNPQFNGFHRFSNTLTAGFIHGGACGGVRALVLAVHYAVVVAVELTAAAVNLGTGWRVGALVAAVSHAVIVAVQLAATAVDAGTGRCARALVASIGHAVVVGIGRGFRGRGRNRAGKGPAQAERYHGVEGAFINAVEFPQIATNGNAITDVVAEAGTHVYPGFIVIGACRTVGNGISQPEVGMACTQ